MNIDLRQNTTYYAQAVVEYLVCFPEIKTGNSSPTWCRNPSELSFDTVH